MDTWSGERRKHGIQGPHPISARDPGNGKYQIEIDAGEPGSPGAFERPLRVCGRVKTTELFQARIPKRLGADAYAVESGLLQVIEANPVLYSGIRLDTDLAFFFKAANPVSGFENPGEVVCVEAAGGAASEKHRCKPDSDLFAPVCQFPADRIDITLVEIPLSRDHGKAAIGTVLRTERNMHVQPDAVPVFVEGD